MSQRHRRRRRRRRRQRRLSMQCLFEQAAWRRAPLLPLAVARVLRRGVTFAEIAARWLARHEGRPFVVATTDVISGDAFMGSLVHTLENGLRSTNG